MHIPKEKRLNENLFKIPIIPSIFITMQNLSPPARKKVFDTSQTLSNFLKTTILDIVNQGKMYCWKKYYKQTYNAYVISVIKPVPDLHTAAKNCYGVNISHPQKLSNNQILAAFLLYENLYRELPLSFLARCWSTSTSSIAASRYFRMLLITLIATYSLVWRSQHSRTWPNVPTALAICWMTQAQSQKKLKSCIQKALDR